MEHLIDGFLDKRSRFGRWDRRYVRTELYNLLYFSEGLDIIEQTRDVGAAQIQRNGGARGGHLHATGGLLPADEVDLRDAIADSVRRVDARGRPLTGAPREAGDERAAGPAYFALALAARGAAAGAPAKLRLHWRAASAREADAWVETILAIRAHLSLIHL